MKLKLASALWLAVHFGYSIYQGHTAVWIIDAALSLANGFSVWLEVDELKWKRRR